MAPMVSRGTIAPRRDRPLAGVMLLLLMAVALEPVWAKVAVTPDGATYTLDLSSIRARGQERTAWIKTVESGHDRDRDYELTLLSIGCRDDTLKVIESITYSNGASHMEGAGTVVAVPPGTAGEYIISWVCSDMSRRVARRARSAFAEARRTAPRAFSTSLRRTLARYAALGMALPQDVAEALNAASPRVGRALAPPTQSR